MNNENNRADALTSMFAAHPCLQDDRAVFSAAQVRSIVREILAASANKTGAEGVPVAWMHADDPRDCISDAKKRDMIEHAGAPGARLADNYSIALGFIDAPAQAAEPVAIPADVLAHIKWLHYCLREAGHCIDGGTCHHECGSKGECWRQDGCVPLTGSRLTDDWKLPTVAPAQEDARAKFEAWWKGNAPSNFDYASALAGYLARAADDRGDKS
jgi:hypothetical protein